VRLWRVSAWCCQDRPGYRYFFGGFFPALFRADVFWEHLPGRFREVFDKVAEER